MKPLILFIAIIASLISFGQTIQYQSLLDTALSRRGAIFVYSKPIIIHLDKKNIHKYAENIRELSNQSPDTTAILEIIDNSKLIDTTLWTDKELPNFLLLNEREETVSKKHALQKLKISDNKQIRFYRKQINQYNSREPRDRNIYYFSRPIFNNAKTFAIVKWDNGYSLLLGGGGISLYKFENEKWSEVGVILRYSY
ncbi:MAG: hypothetical protein QM726_11125 [Chitinophagaceae bacterium]